MKNKFLKIIVLVVLVASALVFGANLVKAASPDLIGGGSGSFPTGVVPSNTSVNTPTTFSSFINNNVVGGDVGTSFYNFFQVATATGGGGDITDLAPTSMSPLCSTCTRATYQSYTFSSPGTYSMRVCADKSNRNDAGSVAESNESNNCGSWSNILVSGTGSLPDLSVGPTSYDIEARTFSATVTNIGNSPTDNPVNQTHSFNNIFEISPDSAGNSSHRIVVPSPSNTLAAGASTTTSKYLTTSYTTSWFDAPGTYYARTCADKNYEFNGNITESDENNNCGPWTAIVIPNLVPVVTISADPSSGLVNIVNPTLYWSATNNPTSCTASGDWSGAKAVNGSESQGVLTSAKVYTYKMTCTNTYGTSTEAVATVNSSATAIGPDLVASAPAPSSVNINTPVNLVSTISNIGNQASNYGHANEPNYLGFANEFQVSDAPNGTGTIIPVGAGWTASLAAGASMPIKKSYTFTSATIYSVRACADSGPIPGAISWGSDETDESNNCSPWTNVTVSGGSLPDLTASTPTPTTAVINTPVTLSSTVTNSGTATTGVSFQNFLQVRDVDGVTIHDLAATSMSALGINASNTTSQSYTFNSAGTYSVRGCADLPPQSNGVVAELDENNNCSSWTSFIVTSNNNLPDLVASSPDQTTATVGVSINFSSTITNGGLAPTGSAFSNFFQVATDSNGGGSVTDLNPTSMNALNPGLFNTTSQSYTFNSVGTYSLRACADKTNRNDTGVITELNEANNCSGWTNVAVSAANVCVPNQGNDCISAPNGCGQINSGSIQCNGSCSAGTPPTPSPCPVCANGATNPPECTFDGNSCLNGATNPPLCTLDKDGRCLNGSSNPPACQLKKPIFKED
ncbi:hypothetical protein IT399_02865 [Candidatus Nomurabacteria bacterium]|nr:hypothetical protein [Candidatus Nomurabacteria bacterium]